MFKVGDSVRHTRTGMAGTVFAISSVTDSNLVAVRANHNSILYWFVTDELSKLGEESQSTSVEEVTDADYPAVPDVAEGPVLRDRISAGSEHIWVIVTPTEKYLISDPDEAMERAEELAEEGDGKMFKYRLTSSFNFTQ